MRPEVAISIGNFTPYNSAETAYSIIALVVSLLGLVACLIVLVSLIIEENKPFSNYLVISLMISDSFLCGTFTVFQIKNLSLGGWSWDSLTCSIISSVFYMTGMVSYSMLALLAIDRYYVCHVQKRVKPKAYYIANLIVWGFCSLHVFIPILSNTFETTVELTSSHLYCSVDRYGHRSILTRY